MIFSLSFIGNTWYCMSNFHFTTLLPRNSPSISFDGNTNNLISANNVQTEKHYFFLSSFPHSVKCILRRLNYLVFFLLNSKKLYTYFEKLKCVKNGWFWKWNPFVTLSSQITMVHILKTFSIEIRSYIMHKYDMCMWEVYKIDLWLIGKIPMRLKPSITILRRNFQDIRICVKFYWKI